VSRVLGSRPTGGAVTEPLSEACDACLRRTDLIAALAPTLDVEWRKRDGPKGVLALSDETLLALDPAGAVARRYLVFDAEAARRRAAGAALTIRCRCSDAYPERLRELVDPPAVLHVLGDPASLDDGEAAAVVGARRGTPYGLEVARALGRGLAAAGVPVVSGLALGVDAAAHQGALETDGPAVAVLAGGADVPYPAVHRRLHARVAARGCVVSELPPGFGAMRWCFVARNRIIAGLAEITIVVEATVRSGSLTTADFAANSGRQVAAVPGPVTSRLAEGTNGLIAAGAALVRDARDVLELLLGPGAVPDSVADLGRPGHRPPAPVTALEAPLRALLDAVEQGRGSLEALTPDAAAAPAILRGLTELERRGLIRRGFGGRYVRLP
jgi:DNA processing protein